jgi:ribosome-associated protein
VIIINPDEFAQKIKEWIEAKNGDDIEVIDVTEMTSIANYFVIASGSSERQVKAIAENIEYEAQKLEIFPKGVEGLREARWILLDYYDVIVHIFHAEEREFYNLEKLWKNTVVNR